MADKTKKSVEIGMAVSGAEGVIRKGRDVQKSLDFTAVIQSGRQYERTLQLIERRLERITKMAKSAATSLGNVGGGGGGATATAGGASAADVSPQVFGRREAGLLRRRARLLGQPDPTLPEPLRPLETDVVKAGAQNARARYISSLQRRRARALGMSDPAYANDPEAQALHGELGAIASTKKTNRSQAAEESKRGRQWERAQEREDRRAESRRTARERHTEGLQRAQERREQRDAHSDARAAERAASSATAASGRRDAKFTRMRARLSGKPNPELPADIAEAQRMNMLAPGSARIARMYNLPVGMVRKGMGAAAIVAGVTSGNPLYGFAGGYHGAAMMGAGEAAGIAGLGGAAAAGIYGLIGGAIRQTSRSAAVVQAAQRGLYIEPIKSAQRNRSMAFSMLGALSGMGVGPEQALAMASEYGTAAGGFLGKKNRQTMFGDLMLAASPLGIAPGSLGMLERAHRRGGVTGYGRNGGRSYGQEISGYGLSRGRGGAEVGDLVGAMAQRSSRAQQSGVLTNLDAILRTAGGLMPQSVANPMGGGLGRNVGFTQGVRLAGQVGNFTEGIAQKGFGGAPNMGIGLLAMQAFGGLDLRKKGGFSADDIWSARERMEKNGPSEKGLRQLVKYAMSSGGSKGQGLSFASDLLSAMGVDAGPEMVRAIAEDRPSSEWRRGRQRPSKALGGFFGATGSDKFAAAAVAETHPMAKNSAVIESLQIIQGMLVGPYKQQFDKVIELLRMGVVAQITGSPLSSVAESF